MIGAIIGDIIGSRFEWHNLKSKDFELFTNESKFTDDTVLTIAIADCILHNKDYAQTVKQYGNAYPNAGYGGRFKKWLTSTDLTPYNSWGNGSLSAIAGYPHITIPLSYVDGLPVGVSFMASSWEESKIINAAFAFEYVNNFIPRPIRDKK